MRKCGQCNSTEIEVDSARGDEVCTNCGAVLADNIIVAEVQFEENAHGTSAAVGQFVSADSKGGATGYGKFHVGTSTESREVTLRKAKIGISHLCNMLALNNHCIETAHNFFKMALSRNLTRGRKNSHIYAACVYITCRTEGTSHLLIDISDALQICCYELGRTYLKLSQALCINVPSIDPCIYIMRFANRLEFADKTHEVSMTAQRLVQRMKKDSLHSGRRPSGLCGAALLLAARMHDFSRKPNDIVRVVKIHESTLRKRLLEFGETPSSALTIDEFMTIDLEAEADPPAFKAARKKDKERLQKLPDESEFTSLQIEIDAAIERDLKKSRKRKLNIAGTSMVIDDYDETKETDMFIGESTIDVINECLQDDPDDFSGDIKTKVVEENKVAVVVPKKEEKKEKIEKEILPKFGGLKPDLLALCTVSEKEQFLLSSSNKKSTEPVNDLDLEGLDDNEINGYILSESEAVLKDRLWNKMNAEYLKAAKEREEKAAKEREEGKPEKKKRRAKKKAIGPSSSAGEAIEKMLQEKKISSKINYDILKSLTATQDDKVPEEIPTEIPTEEEEKTEIEQVLKPPQRAETSSTSPRKSYINLSNNRRSKVQMGLPVVMQTETVEEEKPAETTQAVDHADDFDEDEIEELPEPQHEDDRLGNILNMGDEDNEDAYLHSEDYY
ncbi:transcription factor IIIB 90 kDa subunit [Chironomus tepperi]|uniref:transcription factor IIIB 90 kDa subunit n=1 Tax=Chironomus tepperi TaxID=113505 RepID=UPI00391F7192